jgi:hypothetical protein
LNRDLTISGLLSESLRILEAAAARQGLLSASPYFLVGLLEFLSCFVAADLSHWLNGEPALK